MKYSNRRLSASPLNRSASPFIAEASVSYLLWEFERPNGRPNIKSPIGPNKPPLGGGPPIDHSSVRGFPDIITPVSLVAVSATFSRLKAQRGTYEMIKAKSTENPKFLTAAFVASTKFVRPSLAI